MTTLNAMQAAFQDYLMDNNRDFLSCIKNTETVSAATRLAIYHHAYRARLQGALIMNFPILHAYVGSEVFTKLANDYIMQFPSCYRSIRWFGDQFPVFLLQHSEFKRYPYLSELAHFEWIQTLVFDALDYPALSIDSMSDLNPSDWAFMILHAHPSLHRMNFSWNVVEIWQAISDNRTVPKVVASKEMTPWVTWRYDHLNYFRSLTPDEAFALDSVLAKKSFGDICEGLCQWVQEDEAGLRAAVLLKSWIETGLLMNVIEVNKQ
jgi:hypothetical protein